MKSSKKRSNIQSSSLWSPGFANGTMVRAARKEDILHSLCDQVVRLVLALKNLLQLNQENPGLVDICIQNHIIDVLPFMLGDPCEVAHCGTPPPTTNDLHMLQSREGLWACKWQRHLEPAASLSFDICGDSHWPQLVHCCLLGCWADGTWNNSTFFRGFKGPILSVSF